MNADSLLSGRAVKQPIERNEDIRNAYDSSVYSKGPAVIEMIEAYLGKQRFRSTLRQYLAANQDGVVGSDEFFALVGKLTDDPKITNVFRDFITRPGVPLISVTVDCSAENPHLRLSQKRYTPLGSELNSDSFLATPLVISVGSGEDPTTDDQTTYRNLLTTAQGTVNLESSESGVFQCPSWVLPNSGGMGYYRFNLDEPHWLALAENLNTFEPREALAILDSAIANFQAGTISSKTLLQVVEASSTSKTRQVVTYPFGILGKMGSGRFQKTIKAPSSATSVGSTDHSTSLFLMLLTTRASYSETHFGASLRNRQGPGRTQRLGQTRSRVSRSCRR